MRGGPEHYRRLHAPVSGLADARRLRRHRGEDGRQRHRLRWRNGRSVGVNAHLCAIAHGTSHRQSLPGMPTPLD
ncbi:hypothetical protein XHV734_5059 [Xanthomonas hortorum pv. vitians]|nr:hypothetical protein XHV734_5059 [Xanthomonas hortorum pv. vitians]